MTTAFGAKFLPRRVREDVRALTLRPSAQPMHPWRRLDTLVDGIYAIAATLLVLELRPPVTQSGHLGQALLHQWPQYGVYALGFLQIAAGWSSQRRWSSWCRGIDQYATLLVLGCVALFSLTPFTTAVLASAVRDEADFRSAVRLMAVVVFLAMTLFTAASIYLRRQHLLRDDLEPAGLRTVLLVTYTSTSWPALAFGLSYVSPPLALGSLVVFFLLALWPLDPMTTEQYAAADKAQHALATPSL